MTLASCDYLVLESRMVDRSKDRKAVNARYYKKNRKRIADQRRKQRNKS